MLPPGKMRYIYTTFEPTPTDHIAINDGQKYQKYRKKLKITFCHTKDYVYNISTYKCHYIWINVNNKLINKITGDGEGKLIDPNKEEYAPLVNVCKPRIEDFVWVPPFINTIRKPWAFIHSIFKGFKNPTKQNYK